MRLAIGWRKRKRQVDVTHLSNPVVTTDEAEDDSGESPIGPFSTQGSDDDPGFLDLVEEGVQGFNEGARVLKRIDKHIRELGEKMARSAEDLADATDESGNPNPSKSKGIINAMANDIEGIATGIQAELVPFKSTFTTAIKAYSQAASLLSDFGGETAELLEDAISNTSTLERNAGEAQEALLGLKNAIMTTPRITSKYNRAKKKILEVIGELEREISAVRTSTKQTLQFFEELRGES